MVEHTLGELRVIVEDQDGPLSMRFLGESDSMNIASELRELFAQYLEEARSRGLDLDFRDLEYMNSSSFPPLVELIRQLHDSGTPITVRYSKDKPWQRTPFTAISSIAAVYEKLTVKAC